MTEIIYNESDHRFIDPIRYFKENDPYYWETNNIPLKQLQENCKWLKDQVGLVTGVSGIGRKDFDELRPYSDETSNVIKVKPGRYLSRINHAFDLDPLQDITKTAGADFGVSDKWQYALYQNEAIKSKVDKIFDALADPTFLNGLYERAFVHPSVNTDTPLVNYGTQISDSFKLFVPSNDGWTWINHPNTTGVKEFDLGGADVNQSYVDSLWVKYWRGVARTAVVDIPEELEIEVPPFNINDFTYVDENGDEQPIENQDSVVNRIDLLFVWSKPVDSSAVSILDRQTANKKLYEPTLGILKGAGAGVNITQESIYRPADDTSVLETYPRMMASPADQQSTAGGFSGEGVYGSFPSPEDLLNLTPLLSEKLESNHPALIGQNVLPLAYIVRTKEGAVDGAGKQIVFNSDIIDIRPFFRTAELSYNERAGIAAAMPSISPANPVVGRMEMDNELFGVKRELDSLRDSVSQNSGGTTGGNDPNAYPRTVGTGYVLGGTAFGPEAVIAQHYNATIFGGNGEEAEINQRIKEDHFLPSDLEIPDLPSWDLAKWVPVLGTIGTAGEDPANYIDLVAGSFVSSGEQLRFRYGSYKNSGRVTRYDGWPADRFHRVAICRKTVLIDRSAVGWMGDYHVDVNYFNCSPRLNPGNSTDTDKSAGTANVWVEKHPDKFIIYCAWVPWNGIGNNGLTLITSTGMQNDDLDAAGFYVVTDSITDVTETSTSWGGYRAAGLCVLPSVTFRVTGIPANYASASRNLAGSNPIITLL